jgi:hypothetical protein
MALGSVASQTGVMTVAASPSGKQLPSSRRGRRPRRPGTTELHMAARAGDVGEAANTAAVRHDRRRGRRWP